MLSKCWKTKGGHKGDKVNGAGVRATDSKSVN